MMNRTATRTLEDEIACASHFDGRVMISGERGTGKKFVAHLIHQQSHRRTAPFVIASHRGFAESVPQAQQGTLLIDGIEELTVPMQLQLLQFLESGTTNGSPRLMTATVPDMFDRVRSDTFSADFFYRLDIRPCAHPCAPRACRGHFDPVGAFSVVLRTNEQLLDSLLPHRSGWWTIHGLATFRN